MSDNFKIGDWVKVRDERVFTLDGVTENHARVPDGFLIERHDVYEGYHNPKECSLYNGATSVLSNFL